MAIPPQWNEKSLNFHFWNFKWKFSFWNLKRINHTTREKWKNWNISFVLSRKFWNTKLEKTILNFEKNGHINRGKWKNWNKEIIYFAYATKEKLPIIPYTTYITYAYHPIPHVKLWWYTSLFQQWYRVVWSTIKPWLSIVMTECHPLEITYVRKQVLWFTQILTREYT
jgi:hypothetical protein